MTTAYSAFGTKVLRGDGGVGAGTKASRSVGSSNSILRLKAKTAGTGGNSITFSVVVAGNNTPLSVSVSGNAITINAETDGSAASVSTVNDVIAAIYANTDAAALVDADDSTGDGTGTIAAHSSGALSGGAFGTEVFTEILGAKSITGPQLSLETIDITNHGSAGQYREVLPSFKSGGEVSFDLLYNPADAQHEGLLEDFDDRFLRNFKMELPDLGDMTYSFAAYVSNAEVQAPIDDALMLSVTLSITGEVTRAT